MFVGDFPSNLPLVQSSQEEAAWHLHCGRNFQICVQKTNTVATVITVQKNLDLRNCGLRKNLDIRNIVATTDFLVHKLFDLRKIF